MFKLDAKDNIAANKTLDNAMAWFFEGAQKIISNMPNELTFAQFVSFIGHQKDRYMAAITCVILAHPSRVVFNREDVYLFAQKFLEQKKDDALFCEAAISYDDVYLDWLIQC